MSQRIFTALIFAAIAIAQTPDPCPTCSKSGTPTSAQRWSIPVRTVEVLGDTLTVSLTDGGALSSAWRFAARVKGRPEKSARLQVAEVEVDTRVGTGKPPSISGVEKYNEQEVSMTAQTVDVRIRPGRGTNRTVVFIELPKPMTIVVTSNHREIARALVTESMYIADGKLLADTLPGGLASLLLHSAFGTPDKQAGLQRHGANEFFASPAELASHLIQFTRPPRFETGAFAEGVSVSFLVAVGANGEVKEIISARGDSRLIEHCRPALLGWKFNPFKFDGQIVSPKGSVLMVSANDGTVIIPMIQAR